MLSRVHALLREPLEHTRDVHVELLPEKTEFQEAKFAPGVCSLVNATALAPVFIQVFFVGRALAGRAQPAPSPGRYRNSQNGRMADHPHTVDRWDDATGQNLIEQIATVGDYLIALETQRR